MESAEVPSGYARLVELGHARLTAFMCAGTLSWRCHRRLLSDRLVADGCEVLHIHAPGKTEAHRLWELARLDGGRLIYDVGTLALDESVEGGSRASHPRLVDTAGGAP